MVIKVYTMCTVQMRVRDDQVYIGVSRCKSNTTAMLPPRFVEPRHTRLILSVAYLAHAHTLRTLTEDYSRLHYSHVLLSAPQCYGMYGCSCEVVRRGHVGSYRRMRRLTADWYKIQNDTKGEMETEELYSINISPLVTAPFATQWSADNQISLVTEKGVHVLVSDIYFVSLLRSLYTFQM